MLLRGQSVRKAVTMPDASARPRVTFGQKAILAFSLGLVVIAVVTGDETQNREGRDAIQTCRAEMMCWANKHKLAASDACKKRIETLACYQAEWTNWSIDGIFARAGWDNASARTLTYAGDSVKFQNGFGAFLPHRYECDYDPSLKLATDVRVLPGKLN